MSGIYSYIPKFKKMKEATMPIKDSDDEEKEESKVENVEFDPTTVFQFYSKSSDKPLPGKGAGERVKPEKQSAFSNLASMKGWRKVLSNVANTPFELDGHKWSGVEWYYQGNKFKKNNPEFYLQFSLDSDSEISKNAAMAKSAAGKTGKFKGTVLRKKEMKVDPDFFTSGRAQEVLKQSQTAKYSQNKIAKKVLLDTKDAKLQHYVRGKPPTVLNDIMKVRSILEKQEKNTEKNTEVITI
jgi:predicted NAD-dependent protein-ADP-ribosyltransferase YbiA (DUF1768 family)